ncbi:NAD(P)H-binding protein [Streptomyces zagrosensis]|uniref:Uncharacterized protein YbjT (DUF2867 family) n=1 Tax=Streptomyces zagrosensis TaxID=1042984 RepID=A0A7W9UYC7_9ACTN|nr:NAD(P)H-binding protein [Streptomyces zagrosensis]MBB5935820.1 uncharacterized protein YbjT (DUF2867 family) [Streptomyces zagrosensis]
MTILVTGATGNVGRHVVEQLLGKGHRVRALSRTPQLATLPAEVEVVGGDLTKPETLGAAFDGVSGVHLTTYNGSEAPLTTGPELAELVEKAGVRRVTVLWSGQEGSVERAVRGGTAAWTLIQPGEFMSNSLAWAEAVRVDGVVREPYPQALNATIHEGDVAAVIALALTEDGHEARTYRLSGPQALTVPQKIAALGAALGRELRYVELTDEQARERWRSSGVSAEAIEMLAAWHSNPPPEGYTVVPTVAEVTGRPARTYAAWAAEHVERFR